MSGFVWQTSELRTLISQVTEHGKSGKTVWAREDHRAVLHKSPCRQCYPAGAVKTPSQAGEAHGGYHFWDGDEDSNTHAEDGFTLFHFRQHSVTDVEERRKMCWSRILDEKIVIPAEEVKVYDKDGISTGKMQYSKGVATFVPFSVTQEPTSPCADCCSEQHTTLPPNCTTLVDNGLEPTSSVTLLPNCITPVIRDFYHQYIDNTWVS